MTSARSLNDRDARCPALGSSSFRTPSHGAKINTQITRVLTKTMKFTGKTRLALAAPLPGSDQFRTLRQSPITSHLSPFISHVSGLRIALVAALSLSLACTATVRANDVDVNSGKIKIGFLHSLYGTMAVSKNSLLDTLTLALC